MGGMARSLAGIDENFVGGKPFAVHFYRVGRDKARLAAKQA